MFSNLSTDAILSTTGGIQMAVVTPGTPRGFTVEGPNYEQIRIIAVELAVRDESGTEHELQMFPCQHTIADNPNYYGARKRIRVTVHTSAGDRTLEGYL